MLKKMIVLLTILSVLLTVAAIAFDRRGRLSALNEYDVGKNKSILLRTNQCPGCYLAYAKMSGMNLAHANLRGANLTGVTFIKATLVGADLSGAKIAGANFTGAQWIDGSICQTGSVGRCLKALE